MEPQQKRARLHRLSTAIWLALALWLVISGIGLWKFAGRQVQSTYIYQACSHVLGKRAPCPQATSPQIMPPGRVARAS